MSAHQPKIVPKNQRSKRVLESHAPKQVETIKSSLLLRGNKTSHTLLSLLKDFHILHSPHSISLHKHHQIHPFDDASSLEFLTQKNHAPLFVLAHSSKKRPDSITFGRTYDGGILDLLEFGIDSDSFQSMSAFDGVRQATVRYGSKPLLLFQGQVWETNVDMAVAKSLLLDFFRGEIPRVELDEVGPHVDFHFRRRKQASEDVVKSAMRQPKSTASKKLERKNIEKSNMGDKVGRIHMKRQDLSNLAISKLKGLKRKRNGENEIDEERNDQAEREGTGTDINDSADQDMNNHDVDDISSVSSHSSSGNRNRASTRQSRGFAGGFGPNKSFDSSKRQRQSKKP